MKISRPQHVDHAREQASLGNLLIVGNRAQSRPPAAGLAHHGTIGVENLPVGGSRFCFLLPRMATESLREITLIRGPLRSLFVRIELKPDGIEHPERAGEA
jgi:hypothetical protein